MTNEAYNKFYYSVAKDEADMTMAELGQEIESAEDYQIVCELLGQGINTKEAVRHRRCVAEINSRPKS